MNDLKLIRDIQILYNKDVYFWGAGKIGMESAALIEGCNINVVGFCDNNEQLEGSYIKKYKVFSPKEIKAKIIQNDNIVIVITSNYLEQIHQQLVQMGMDSENIFSKFALYYSLLRNIDCVLIPDNYRDSYKRKYGRWKIINHKRADYRFSFKYYAYNWEKIIQDNPIVIYQPGKVASTTLFQSIKSCGMEVIQTHALAYREEFMDKDMKDLYSEFRNSCSQKHNIKIISGVREPIKRDISYLFEHINLPFVELYDTFDNDLLQDLQDCLGKFFTAKVDRFQDMSPTLIHHMIRVNGGIFQWFERELRQVYQINILDYPFDKEKGYAIIKKENVELLIYKMEKLDNLETVIGDFIGIDNFRIRNTNLASDRDYRYAYKQVLDTVQLPESYINLYYMDNVYMDHFYTKKEKDNFLRQWRRNSE